MDNQIFGKSLLTIASSALLVFGVANAGSLAADKWLFPAEEFGSNTYIGKNFYANFNLTVVDDGECHIGDYVMLAPNVVISTTGHPVHPSYRDKGAQFSLPVVIKDHVWIGSNVTIMPGVTIGENSVIGAGSVVTKDIPANVVACGVPCRVLREITEDDAIYYRPGMKINEDWDK